MDELHLYLTDRAAWCALAAPRAALKSATYLGGMWSFIRGDYQIAIWRAMDRPKQVALWRLLTSGQKKLIREAQSCPPANYELAIGSTGSREVRTPSKIVPRREEA